MVALLRKTACLSAVSILFCTMLTACAILGPTPDPTLGQTQKQSAEQLFDRRQYTEAATQYGLAVHNLPRDGILAARQGETLEQLQRFEEARDAYRRGVKKAEDNLLELRYQLARLEAYRFQNPDMAEKVARQLPPRSWQRTDIDALVQIRRGDPETGLNQLVELTDRLPDQSAAAFVTFHIAVASEQLGNIPNAFSSLHESVNRVAHKGLSREIELFWNYLNQTYPLRPRIGS